MRIPLQTFEVFEAGVYPARIASVEEVNGQYGQQLRIKFDLPGGHNLTTWTSCTFSGKSKLGQLVRACYGGQELPEGHVLDTDTLPGKQLRLLLTVEERSDGQGSFNKVAQFMPSAQPRPAAPAPRPAPAPKPAPFDDDGIFDGAPPVNEDVPF